MPNETETPSTPNALAAALGSVSLQVTTVVGNPLHVAVRLLRVSEFPQFFELVEKEEELVALATDLKPAEIECLSPNSVLDLIDKIFELNFTTAQRWAERRARLGSAAASFQKRVVETSPS